MLISSKYRLPFALGILAAVLFGAPTPVSAQSYFDWLSSQTETILSRSYKSQAEIDGDLHGKLPSNNIHFDPEENAAKITIKENSASIQQIRPNFPAQSSGTLLFTWDAKWGEHFARDRTGLNNHKTYQLSHDGPGDDRRIEIRNRYSLVAPPSISTVDVRLYYHDSAEGRAPAGPQAAQFIIEPSTWTRYWAYVDFDTSTFSMWMADENRQPIALFAALPIAWTNGHSRTNNFLLNQFWFEYNSSQSRTGPELFAWFRNFVVMKNVADVNSVIAQGANVDGSSPPSDAAPGAPSNLRLSSHHS